MWNDYLWPLVVLVDPDQVTLPVELGQLNRVRDTNYGVLTAGTVIPLLIVFLVAHAIPSRTSQRVPRAADL